MAKSGKRVLFSGNEALSLSDLNEMQMAMTQRAWEYPGYADMMAPWVTSGVGWESSFLTPVDAVINKCVFTKGGGLRPFFSGTTVSIGSGFIGTRMSGVSPGDVVLAGTDPLTVWGMREAYDASFDLSANLAGAGEFKYILIRVATADTSSDSATRHFKDSTTGVVSSASTNKRFAKVYAWSIQEGGSGASPVVPALADGYALVAIARVSDAAVTHVIDCTIPHGPLRIVTTYPGDAGLLHNVSGWVKSVSGIASTPTISTSACIVPPFAANPQARLIAAMVKYDSTAGDRIEFRQRVTGPIYNVIGVGPGSGSHFTGEFQASATPGAGEFQSGVAVQRLFTFLTPALLSGSGVALWGEGSTVKGLLESTDVDTTLGMVVRSNGAANMAIYGVKWFYAIG